MHGLKTSFKTFRAPIRCKLLKPAKQQIRVTRNWIIRGNKRKCLECKGITRIILRGKSTGFYDVNLPYPHKPECKNK